MKPHGSSRRTKTFQATQAKDREESTAQSAASKIASGGASRRRAKETWGTVEPTKEMDFDDFGMIA